MRKHVVMTLGVFAVIALLTTLIASALPFPSIWGRASGVKEGYDYSFNFFVARGGVVSGGYGYYYWPKPGVIIYECTTFPIKARSYNIWRWDYWWNGAEWREECMFEGWAQVNMGDGWSSPSVDPSESWWIRVTIWDNAPGRENQGEDEMFIELWAPGQWNIDLDTHEVTLPSAPDYDNILAYYEYKTNLPFV